MECSKIDSSVESIDFNPLYPNTFACSCYSGLINIYKLDENDKLNDNVIF